MKPSESSPLSGSALAEAVVDAGFPAGAVNVAHGRGDVGVELLDEYRTATLEDVQAGRLVGELARIAASSRLRPHLS